MCGICGELSFRRTPRVDLIERMMGRLLHRGPDGGGWFRDEQCALGHTRLAIIGLETGAQPIPNEDESVWVSFNGEIFNYIELRDELVAAGHRFSTETDTEVIVHAWEHWGMTCFDRFNGQWAIALWDRSAAQLILSRDRMGIRPLYYVEHEGRLLFASEVKALFADPAIPREMDPEGLGQTFTYWSTIAPTTVFRGVRQLPPGHTAVVDQRGIRVKPYWEPHYPPRGGEPSQDLQENESELRSRLVEACRLRFQRSDVPVGAYLSGGIDSSITSAIVARYTEAPLHTFSLRFSDDEFDEGRFQREMVRRLGAEHQEVVVSSSDIGAVFPEVVRHTETPILRTAPAPLFLLSRLVRDQGFKVVVTGEGADEVLAGYDIFREARVRQFWARNRDSEVRPRAAELLYPWMARSPGQAPAFARGFFGRNLDPDDPALSHRPRWDSTSALHSMLDPDMRQQLPDDLTRAVLAMMPSESIVWDPLSRAQWLESTTLLPGYLLSSQGDRMLMANSVEGRFPFLDRNVVEFANSLPARHKLLGLDEKHILKRAFQDLVPEDILSRAKQPYRSPDAASFFDPEPDWVGDVLSPAAVAAAGVFSPRLVEGLTSKLRRNRGRASSNTDNMRIVAVASTQLLYEQFINHDGGPDAPPPHPYRTIDLLERRRTG